MSMMGSAAWPTSAPQGFAIRPRNPSADTVMNSRRVSVTGDIVRFFVMFVAGALATGFGYQSSPPNRPWPPGVQRVSPESPALSPEESLNTFYMPPGYRLELVAAEPLIQDPVALDWDVDGR